MSRPVFLSNGSMSVGLNEAGLVHDFYYPYIGLENLTTARSAHHKIGVFVDGHIYWVDEDSWHIAVDMSSDYLGSKIRMENTSLALTLDFTDFVDSDINLFGRFLTLTNHSSDTRDIKIFFHQVFEISQSGRADTALFVPEENYILDYKGRSCLLVYAEGSDGKKFDQYSIGNHGIEGKQGTYMDAEDGELSNNPVEHGGVDSTIRLSTTLEPGKSENFRYWILASDSQFELEKINKTVLQEGLISRLHKTKVFWTNWLAISASHQNKINPANTQSFAKSLMIIKSHTDRHGGVIASCDSSIYNYGRDYYSYVWPRDGAYAMWPLIRLGYTEEPKKFFIFCRDILNPDGYLMHKYQPDRAIGSTWHPLVHGNRKELAIQEDETALVLYMLGEFYDYTNDTQFISDMYDRFIEPVADFMSGFVDEQTGLPHASYDLWEEKFGTSHYTTAIVYASLKVACKLAKVLNKEAENTTHWQKISDQFASNSSAFFDINRKTIRKGYLLLEDGSMQFDNTLDLSSFYAAFMFEYAGDKNQITATASVIEEELLNISPSGGTARYEYDRYFMSPTPYKGNPWFVSSFWVAQYYVRIRQNQKAEKIIEWATTHALPSGVFPEQLDPQSGKPTGVAPLIWSHAEYLNTLLDIAENN